MTSMASTQLRFDSQAAHLAWLREQAALPLGFRVGTARFGFVPVEAPKPAQMTITLIALDEPSPAFAAMFTKNAFPGAPVIIGRRRLASAERLGAIVVNNKISNVCAPGGVEASERICAEAGKLLGLPASAVLPSSTGVIGWQLPVDALCGHLPQAVANLSADSILPAAQGICTTDLYPKVRSVRLGAGRVVGIAKGAGMIEPNLATMLVYVLTDLAISRQALQEALREAVDESFNCMSIDSDTSTSDTVVAVSSGRVPWQDLAAFRAGLGQVCRDLAEDVVRNGEGVHHVIRVTVRGAPDRALARAVGKSVVNSPLFQCAVAGNDPNVGRLVCAVGKHLGGLDGVFDLSRARMAMGGIELMKDGVFALDPRKEAALVEHLKAAELYASVPPADGLTFRPPVSYPPHERNVEIEIELGLGDARAVVLGADRTHEYISENADYRS
jgi:glutamate N-acetyltransferase/amino-acid N-acetyltransferase